MIERNIKVKNPNKYAITVNLIKLNGRTITLNPKGFAMFDEDEIAYLTNASSVFKKGILVIENKENLKLVREEDIKSPNVLTDEEIEDVLKLSQKGLASKLEEIDNIEVVKRILEIAKEKGKSIKSIELIENRIEELLLQ